MLADMLRRARWPHHVDLCVVALLLLLSGLQQVQAAAAAVAVEMSVVNWKPFIYGGMASIVAEFGRRRHAPSLTLTLAVSDSSVLGAAAALCCHESVAVQKIICHRCLLMMVVVMMLHKEDDAPSYRVAA